MDIEHIENSFKVNPSKKFSFAKRGMVASAFPDATKAGVEMLRKGGNAVDAACATALALGVCEPQASGIGGQSLAILHINDKSVAVDGSSRSPSLAHSSVYVRKKNRKIGYKATTVPSTLSTIGYMHKKYGRLEWQTIVAPSIQIAKQGYKITQLQHDLQIRELESFLSIKSKSGAKYFLKDGLVPYEVGDRFIQNDLAHTLSIISENGFESFYHGDIAKKIDQDMRNNRDLVREEDLVFIRDPIEKKPISRKYRRVSVVTMPPPAAGRTLLLTLMMLNHLPSKFLRSGKMSSYHFVAETFRKAFLYRTQQPLQRHTYDQTDENVDLQRHFAKQMAESIHDSMDANLANG